MPLGLAQALLLVAAAAAITWIAITGMKTMEMMINQAVQDHFDEVFETERELLERLDEQVWTNNAGDPIFLGGGKNP